MQRYQYITYKILLILALSSFTHLWNPIGFPDLFFDEGVYMRRAMHILNNLDPQESYFYDHPYFGQIFLAGMLALVNFPSSQDVGYLYLVPRVWMGILAVIDTFLIYKIADKQYNRRVALIAAVLFAVMPITWFFRRILLDSLLMPLLLSSILFALYANKRSYAILSGIFLGLAIFTKIPIVMFIPLVAYLVYKNTDKKLLGLWFIPTLLIPLLWPMYSITNNQFDLWFKDILWQSNRVSEGSLNIIKIFMLFDPVLFALGIGGLVYAMIKKEMMILLFMIPFIAYLSAIGYTQYFHWMPILPAFAIAGASILDIVNKRRFGFYLLPIIIIFGFISTTMLITTNLTSAQFDAMKYVTEHKKTIVASPVYSWIFQYIYRYDTLPDYRTILFYPTPEEVLLITDNHFIFDSKNYEQLAQLYNDTRTIASFEGEVNKYDNDAYPYTNMKVNHEGSFIDVRVKP